MENNTIQDRVWQQMKVSKTFFSNTKSTRIVFVKLGLFSVGLDRKH